MRRTGFSREGGRSDDATAPNVPASSRLKPVLPQDGEYRLEFQQWINKLWEDKDALLDRMYSEYPPAR